MCISFSILYELNEKFRPFSTVQPVWEFLFDCIFLFTVSSPYYSYRWKRGWSGPWFYTTLLALLRKCVLMQTSIFKQTFHEKRREVCIKRRSVSASLSLKGKDTKLTTVKWYSVLHATSPTAPNFISQITAGLNVLYYFMPFPSTPVRTLKEILVLQYSLL